MEWNELGRLVTYLLETEVAYQAASFNRPNNWNWIAIKAVHGSQKPPRLTLVVDNTAPPA